MAFVFTLAICGGYFAGFVFTEFLKRLGYER